jgi:pyruvate,orthophosphate dikinase
MARERLVWDVADLDPSDVARFGGKGTGLARMAHAGIPVPPAFVIGTDAFRLYHADGERIPGSLHAELDDGLARLEERSGKQFGRGEGAEPLLVSVRSGAAVSMPGMMDTVLNLGLDARSARAWAGILGDPAFATETWIRFWRMFGEIVLNVDTVELERATARERAAALADPSDACFEGMERAIVAWFAARGATVETRPREQLELAIAAVFGSWNSRRARAYRKNQAISDELGTAVTVQTMVFGNRDARSGSGVAFSRNPNTGERGLFGEYVVGRQGEDLVAGTATPIELSRPDALERDLHEALTRHASALERLYRDAVDIEFTVEANRLHLLQVRPAKRTAEASVRIATDLLRDGAIDAAEAVMRVTPEQLGRLLRPTFDPAAREAALTLTVGIASSPGNAAGRAIIDADEAADRAAAGERVILLRPTTSPQDIRGMLTADGIVTARGGALSHAAVVSRALDKPCVVGCESIRIDVDARTFAVSGRVFSEGTEISIDGESGAIYLGSVPLVAQSGGGAELGDLLAAATALSGARVSVAALDFGDLERANEPGEHAIVGITDLLVSSGSIDRLTSAIGRLVGGRDRDAAATDIERLVCDVARRAFAVRPGRVAFRLPSFLSERARQIVPDWAALPATSLLPIGDERFHVPLVVGISRAAREANVATFDILLSGVTEPTEMAVFRNDVALASGVAFGVVVRSFAGLENFAARSEPQTDVWIDVDAIVRSAYAFPSELFSAQGSFASYLARGSLTIDPQTTLAPFLETSLGKLIRSTGPERVGAILGAASPRDAASTLYALGYRRFAVLAGARERLRLHLGRTAAEGMKR